MKNINGDSKPKRCISRRDFLRLLKFTGLEAALIAFGGGVYMREYEPSWLEVAEVNLKLPRLAKSFSGFRLVQISDIHYGGWMTAERLSDFLDAALALSPDFIAITGDFVLGHNIVPNMSDLLDDLAVILSRLSSRFPTAGIFGNHDGWLSRTEMVSMLDKAGLMDLNNAVHALRSGGEALYIAGLDDIISRYHRMDEVLARLPDDGCAVLLAHEPDYADTSAGIGRFDLQISGHSHGGQFVLPYVGPLVLPRMARIYPQGLYRVGNMYQYTNRGVGMTPPNVRFNCRPEITVFTLSPA